MAGRWVDACRSNVTGRERWRLERPKMGAESDQRNLVCAKACERNCEQDLFTCRQHEDLQLGGQLLLKLLLRCDLEERRWASTKRSWCLQMLSPLLQPPVGTGQRMAIAQSGQHLDNCGNILMSCATLAPRVAFRLKHLFYA